MRKTFAALAFAAACLVGADAQAAGQALVGPGAGVTCGMWLKERSVQRDGQGNGPLRELIYLAWAQGYLSGVNVGSLAGKSKMVVIPDPAALSAWLDQYCRSNPLKEIFRASNELFFDLAGAQNVQVK